MINEQETSIKKLPLTSDYVFKRIFGQEENKKACSGTGVGTSLSFGGVEKEKAFYAFSLSRLFGLKTV